MSTYQLRDYITSSDATFRNTSEVTKLRFGNAYLFQQLFRIFPSVFGLYEQIVLACLVNPQIIIEIQNIEVGLRDSFGLSLENSRKEYDASCNEGCGDRNIERPLDGQKKELR